MTRTEAVIDRLNRLERGGLTRVAELSDVATSTVTRIARGEFRNPGILTVEAIEAALDQLETHAKPTADQRDSEGAGVEVSPPK